MALPTTTAINDCSRLRFTGGLEANRPPMAGGLRPMPLHYWHRMLQLDTPVQYVKGIGPRLAEVLLTKGITIVEDLLYYLPFRYEDRLNPRRIGELQAGEMASIVAEVRGSMLMRTRSMPLFELTVGDPVRPEPSPERVQTVPPGPAQKRLLAG